MKEAKPPKVLEAAVALLTPPARREETIGDLHERYTSPGQYVADALQVLGAIVWSQVRRTTDLQTLLIESCGLYASFLSAALWLEPRTAGDPLVLLRVLIPAVIMQLAFIVANAYAPAHSKRAPFVSATVSAACLFLARGILPAVAPEWLILRFWPSALGCAGGTLVLASSKLLFRLRQRPLQLEPSTGETSMTPQSISDRKRDFKNKLQRENLGRLVAVAVLAVMGIIAAISQQTADRTAGAIIIALALYILYQTYKRWSVTGAGPAGASPELEYRTELERHRDDLLNIWSWYVLPFVTALLLFALRLPLSNLNEPGLWPRVTPFAVLSVLWSVVMVKLSRRAASKLQSEIDELTRR